MNNRLALLIGLLLVLQSFVPGLAQGVAPPQIVIEFVDSTTGNGIKGPLDLQISMLKPHSMVPNQFPEQCTTGVYSLLRPPAGTLLTIQVEGLSNYRAATSKFVVDAAETRLIVKLVPKVRPPRGMLLEGRVEWLKPPLLPCPNQSIRVVRGRQSKAIVETTTEMDGSFLCQIDYKPVGKWDSLFVEAGNGSLEFLPARVYLDPLKANDFLVIRLQPQVIQTKIAITAMDGGIHAGLEGAGVRVESAEEVVLEGITDVNGQLVQNLHLLFDIDSLQYTVFKKGYASMTGTYSVSQHPEFVLFRDSVIIEGELKPPKDQSLRVSLVGRDFTPIWTWSIDKIYRFMVSREDLRMAADTLHIEIEDGDRMGEAPVAVKEVVGRNRYRMEPVIDPRSQIGRWRNHLVLGFGCAGVQRFQQIDLDNANAFVELLIARERWKNWYFGTRFGFASLHYTDTIAMYPNVKQMQTDSIILNVREHSNYFFPLSVVVKYGYRFREFPWVKFIGGVTVSLRTQTGMLGVALLPGRRLIMEVFGTASVLNFKRSIAGFHPATEAKMTSEIHEFFGRAFLGTSLSIRL